MDGTKIRGLFVFLLLVVIGLVPVGGAGAQQGRYTVLIDPAHGGEDPGVVSDRIREKDLTLNLAPLIRQEAKKTPGLQIQLTRSEDRTVTTADRIKSALAAKPDCLISLHINAGFGKKAAGYEVYFPGFRQGSPGSVETAPIIKDMERNKHLNDSVRLAQRIQASLESVFPRMGRGLREAPNPFLEGLNIPGLVVEVGFATHPEDRKKLTGEEAQRAVARALLKGLQGYFEKGP